MSAQPHAIRAVSGFHSTMSCSRSPVTHCGPLVALVVKFEVPRLGQTVPLNYQNTVFLWII